MSRLNELDLTIQNIAQGDTLLEAKLRTEINEHLHGNILFQDLSNTAQYVLDVWETEHEQELAYACNLGQPIDDDDIPFIPDEGEIL